MGRHPFVYKEKRKCKVCRSVLTDINKKTGCSQWYGFENGWLCQKCHNRLVKNPKFHSIKNPQRIFFKGRQIQIKRNPRIGVCNLCRNVVPFDCKKTDIHHVEYDHINPLKNTIEVCTSCHKKQH